MIDFSFIKIEFSFNQGGAGTARPNVPAEVRPVHKGLLGWLFGGRAKPENPYAHVFDRMDQAEMLHQNFLAWLATKNFQVMERDVKYDRERIDFIVNVKGAGQDADYKAHINLDQLWCECHHCHELWIQRTDDGSTFSETMSLEKGRKHTLNLGQLAADWLETDMVAAAYDRGRNCVIKSNVSEPLPQLP